MAIKNRLDSIAGVGVALVTPFDEHREVDYAALERLVERVIEEGVDYLVALGTTAETPTLTKIERTEILNLVRRVAAGRLPIVLGVGGYSTKEVLEVIKATDLTGVTALLCVTPYYNRPSQEGLFQHYKAVAQASPVPLILYNVPARTGVNMTAQTTLRIAREVDNVAGIKEASGIISQMSKILVERPKGFKVISGDDVLAIAFVTMGGDGVISVAANAFTKSFTQMVKDASQGRVKQTAEAYKKLFKAMEALFEEGNPTGVKTALEVKGLTRKEVRPPLVEGTEMLTRKLKKLIRDGGI